MRMNQADISVTCSPPELKTASLFLWLLQVRLKIMPAEQTRSWMSGSLSSSTSERTRPCRLPILLAASERFLQAISFLKILFNQALQSRDIAINFSFLKGVTCIDSLPNCY